MGQRCQGRNVAKAQTLSAIDQNNAHVPIHSTFCNMDNKMMNSEIEKRQIRFKSRPKF